MIQDSLFAESFWNPISKDLFYDDDDEEIFELQDQDNAVVLRLLNGYLLTSTQQIELIQTYVSLDERGVTLQNQFGQLNCQGASLNKFYEAIYKYCIHLNIQQYFEVQQVTHNLEKFQILQVREKMTGMAKSIKKYSKSIGKQYLKRIIKLSKYESIYEDEQNIYIVVQYLSGCPIDKLTFEQQCFGLLKMLYKYHNQGYIMNQLTTNNIIVLDDNFNMEILDNYYIEKMSQEYQKEISQDVQIIHNYLIIMFPEQKEFLSEITNGTISSVQELLFNQLFIQYFGESEFYRLLNANYYQRQNHLSNNSQINLIETFNTIRSSVMDSSDESEENLINKQFNSLQFDDSPMLSPKPIPKHKSQLSSRQVVLETLLHEHIITQQQFQQFYKEEDFQNEQEINEFSEMLSKEIENSQLTTPIQSDSNTTCPNTVIIHSKKNVVNRICDIIHEAQQELIQKKPYNVNRVQNVRKNLFNMQ